MSKKSSPKNCDSCSLVIGEADIRRAIKYLSSLLSDDSMPIEDGVTLGSIPVGQIAKVGSREYIVLEHIGDETVVITKDFAASMTFGESGDYLRSSIRTYCNNEFYYELADAVGEENIVKHRIDLTADDGSGDDIACEDFVSILTTEKYRRYSKLLAPYGKSWWTATRVSANKDGYARCGCDVHSDGVLSWNDCGYGCGVRPFCILKSSVLVS